MTTPDALCICGHPRAAHEHCRAGTECTFCGAEVCPRFRRRPRRFWERLRLPAR